MGRSELRPPRPAVVSASELAEMGVCERRVLLAHRDGPKWTSAQRRAMRRGLRAHGQFYRDGLTAREAESRCLCPVALASLARSFVWGCLQTVLALLRALAGCRRRARNPGEGE